MTKMAAKTQIDEQAVQIIRRLYLDLLFENLMQDEILHLHKQGALTASINEVAITGDFVSSVKEMVRSGEVSEEDPVHYSCSLAYDGKSFTMGDIPVEKISTKLAEELDCLGRAFTGYPDLAMLVQESYDGTRVAQHAEIEATAGNRKHTTVYSYGVVAPTLLYGIERLVDPDFNPDVAVLGVASPASLQQVLSATERFGNTKIIENADSAFKMFNCAGIDASYFNIDLMDITQVLPPYDVAISQQTMDQVLFHNNIKPEETPFALGILIARLIKGWSGNGGMVITNRLDKNTQAVISPNGIEVLDATLSRVNLELKEMGYAQVFRTMPTLGRLRAKKYDRYATFTSPAEIYMIAGPIDKPTFPSGRSSGLKRDCMKIIYEK